MTALLATALLATALQDRTSIVHDMKVGSKASYDLTYNTKLPDGDSVSKAVIEIESMRSYQDGKTEIEMRMSKVDFVEGEVGHSFKSAVMGFTVTKNGIPVDSVFDSIESMASASLIALFLPGRQIAVGESFDYKYEGPSLNIKLKGNFDSFVDHKGQRLVKIVTSGTVSPTAENVGELTLTTLYDASAKEIVEAHAVIALSFGDIVIDLVRKS